MLTAHNFSYGLVTPVLAYLMSCLGAFLGLRCTARARAVHGRERLRRGGLLPAGELLRRGELLPAGDLLPGRERLPKRERL